MVLSKSNPNHIYVAGQVQTGEVYYMGLHFSQDGGDNWTSVKVSPRSGSCGLAVGVDPTNDNIIYVGGYDSSPNPLLCKSTNRGSTWTDITGGIQGWCLTHIKVDPISPNVVYVVNQSGVWKSKDSGSTWTNARGGWTTCVVINRLNPNEVFSGGGGVNYSNDKGNTWQDVSADLAFCDNVTWLEFDPSARILYASTDCAGIYWRQF